MSRIGKFSFEYINHFISLKENVWQVRAKESSAKHLQQLAVQKQE